MTRFSKGLQGVIAGESQVGYVEGLNGILLYRGYPVQLLARQASYEEVVYLLLKGKLPNKNELASFDKTLRKKRSIPPASLKIMELLPKNAHAMETLQTIVAAIGAFEQHGTLDKLSLSQVFDQSLDIIARFPTIVASLWRIAEGKKALPPDEELNHSSNFLYMATGKKPDPEGAKIFDSCLTLHAEHSFNASTFTARVVSSSLPSLYATISAAVGSLYGPLHGGANEQVLRMIEEVSGPEAAEEWVLKKLEKKEKIMGMGHRIYRVKDPRSHVLEEMLAGYAKQKNNEKDYKTLKKIETVMQREMEKKGKDIWPNVDFFSGALYRLLGIPVSLFTPIFAIARAAGWCAHVLEQLGDNRIFRPVCEYVGPKSAEFVPLNAR